MLVGIKYMLDVKDMHVAVEFFTSTFGLDVASQSEFWTELTFGDAVVALHGGREGDDLVKTGLSFTVDDLDSAVAAVAANGGKVLNGPFSGGPGVLLAELLDPDNNAFMASQNTDT
jgi:predicted enzyme related to lactoylglutathione lyase